jgi:hypothetical protein
LLVAGLSALLPAAAEFLEYGELSLYGRDSIYSALLGAFLATGGVATLTARALLRRRASKFRKFAAVIGNREIVSLSAIAAAAGVSENAVRRDLQSMMDSGWFDPSAYIDEELDCFASSFAAAAAAHEKAAADSGASTSVRATAADGKYMDVIIELRAINIAITDIAISDKIDRIEILTGKIFRIVEENPLKLPQIRRFMDYYLPTTLKLLHTYATLEKQGGGGENITSSKESINKVLDKLALGFEQQLDQLFKSDVIDISSDISVLENMMTRDGLAGGSDYARAAGNPSGQSVSGFAAPPAGSVFRTFGQAASSAAAETAPSDARSQNTEPTSQ